MNKLLLFLLTLLALTFSACNDDNNVERKIAKDSDWLSNRFNDIHNITPHIVLTKIW